jgi:hypothetical protein
MNGAANERHGVERHVTSPQHSTLVRAGRTAPQSEHSCVVERGGCHALTLR